MKKRIVILAAFLVALTAVSWFGPTVFAQSALTDEQRERIRANCVSIKNTLNQLKASDALLRVNRGQIYESMRGKLMDNFNARLGNNGLDAQGLITVTTSYDNALNTFRSNYQAYERQLSTAIRIDCVDDPDGFHLAVENARTKRSTVHGDVVRLHALIDDYRAAVADFKLNFQRISEDN